MSIDVSIIITTRNRCEHLRQTLVSFGRLDSTCPLRGELIVVDNGSSDATRETVLGVGRMPVEVKYLFEGRKGKCRALNLAMAEARGGIFLFTDDDVRVPVDWMSGMTRPILAGEADAIAGGVAIPPHLQRPWMCDVHRRWMASTAGLPQGNARWLVGANMGFRKTVLEKVPAFDPELGPGALGFGDETLLSRQFIEAGLKLRTAFETCVEHHFEDSRLQPGDFLKSAVSRGASDAYIDFHWEHKEIRRVRLKFWKLCFDSAFRRIMRQGRNNSEEALTLDGIHLVKKYGYLRQFCRMSGHPRNYARHGLTKLGSQN